MGIPSRRASHQPVELIAIDAVPDIMRFVVGIFALPSGQSFEERRRIGKVDAVGSTLRLHDFLLSLVLSPYEFVLLPLAVSAYGIFHQPGTDAES